MSIETDSPNPSREKFIAGSRRFFRWLTKPYVVLSLIMLVFMFVMVIVPLFQLVKTSLVWGPSDLSQHPEAVKGELTVYHYTRMLSGRIAQIYTYAPLKHSLTIAAGSTLLALAIGGGLAWLVVRTDMPGRKLINQLAVLPYIMPSWTLAEAWLVFFKNRLSGGTPGVYEFLVGHPPPNWLSYGPVPIIICCALHYYTFFFLFVSASFMSIDSNLEEAGELMGAKRWRILRRITFPLVIPAILSGFIMTFSKALGTFGTPNVLGSSVKYFVLSTMLRGSLEIGDKADAFILAIVLILFAMVTIWLNQRVVGTRKSYETIGGRGFQAQISKLGKLRKVFFVIVVVFQILVIVVPIGLLTYSSLMLVDGNYAFSNLTLQNWIGPSGTQYNYGLPGVLFNPQIWATAWNSIKLAVLTALFTAIIGVILGYSIVKGRGTFLSKLVEQVAFIPYVVPGIAFGAVYIAMFARKLGPLPSLYGTFALLVVVSVAKHLPVSSRSGVSSMMQVGHELEEAAMVSGGSTWQRFSKIIFPLTTSGFASGFLLTFITTMRELSLIIVLVTPTTQVLASQTMYYTEKGQQQMANIVILILIALVALGNFIFRKVVKGGSLEKGLGF